MVKNNQLIKSQKQAQKSYVFYYDSASEHMVFEIHDTEGMLPLLIKGPFEKTYELICTKNGRLNIR